MRACFCFVLFVLVWFFFDVPRFELLAAPEIICPIKEYCELVLSIKPVLRIVYCEPSLTELCLSPQKACSCCESEEIVNKICSHNTIQS